VRGEDHIVQAPQRAVGGERLLLEDVEGRAGQPACLQCFLGGGGMLGCVGGMPNGTCEAGETPQNCPDCP